MPGLALKFYLEFNHNYVEVSYSKHIGHFISALHCFPQHDKHTHMLTTLLGAYLLLAVEVLKLLRNPALHR